MTKSDVAAAAAVGGVSGVLSLVAFALVVTSVNTARKRKQAAPAGPKLTVVPRGAS